MLKPLCVYNCSSSCKEERPYAVSSVLAELTRKGTDWAAMSEGGKEGSRPPGAMSHRSAFHYISGFIYLVSLFQRKNHQREDSYCKHCYAVKVFFLSFLIPLPLFWAREDSGQVFWFSSELQTEQINARCSRKMWEWFWKCFSKEQRSTWVTDVTCLKTTFTIDCPG